MQPSTFRFIRIAGLTIAFVLAAMLISTCRANAQTAQFVRQRAGLPTACARVSQIIVNTSDNTFYRCTTPGNPGTWTAILSSASLASVFNLYADATDVLAVRRGANPQTLLLYNTYTDGSNYERLNIAWASDTATITTAHAGTGTGRALSLNTSGTAHLFLGTGGTSSFRVDGNTRNIMAVADNTYDIGAVATGRVRNIYAATNIFTADDAYAAGWNGSSAVPTKNAIYDKIETLAGSNIKSVTAYPSAATSISSATWTSVPLNTEDHDDDSIHDNATNNTRFTVPSGVTRCTFSGLAQFATGGTGLRYSRYLKGGTTSYGLNIITPPSAEPAILVFPTVTLSVTSGEFFEMQVFQSTAGPLDLTGGAGLATYFSALCR